MYTFPRYTTVADASLDEWSENKKDWDVVLDEYTKKLKKCTFQGPERQQIRHKQRGMLLARDRVAFLLDEDSPFLEVCSFAGLDIEDGSPCASLVAGIGLVSGRMCMILAHIPTIYGGSWTPATVWKQNRIIEISMNHRLPLISLVHSAGVFLPSQFKVFHTGGNLFRDLARKSQMGAPSCAIVFGSSTAGGAYHPGMSDYTIFVEAQAMTALGGPALVKMATGEQTTNEEVGGAKMHSEISGLSDGLATDE